MGSRKAFDPSVMDNVLEVVSVQGLEVGSSQEVWRDKFKFQAVTS